MLDYGPKLSPPAAAAAWPGPARFVFAGKIMNSMKSVTVMVMDGVGRCALGRVCCLVLCDSPRSVEKKKGKKNYMFSLRGQNSIRLYNKKILNLVVAALKQMSLLLAANQITSHLQRREEPKKTAAFRKFHRRN